MIATENDLLVIERLTAEFYLFSQQIIEMHYLQPLLRDGYGVPLPEKIKTTLKDGDIERPLHGGMHVGRAQFWALILHEKIKEMLPGYIKEVTDRFLAGLQLTEKQVLILIRYAILFHDSARESESQDLWDKKSAQNCYNFFIQQGLSHGVADLFSQAAALKDNAEKYTTFLQDKQVEDNDLSSFHYIRKIIYLSDCLDIIRCVGQYHLSQALTVFQDVPEFQPLIHTENVIVLVKHIYFMIRKQRDMLYPCIIILPNNTLLNVDEYRSCFSLKSKVAIEHANNVCSVLGESIKEDPYFSSYLTKEKLLDVDMAEVEPVFNPYVHGTNSLILPMFKRTQFAMHPLLEMLEEYGMAPMARQSGQKLNEFS